MDDIIGNTTPRPTAESLARMRGCTVDFPCWDVCVESAQEALDRHEKLKEDVCTEKHEQGSV